MPPPTSGSSDAKPPGRLASLRHPLLVTAVSALLGGWLIPAFVHQWQDRQKERELKRGLVTQLDRDATTAVIAGRILIDRRFPEAQTTEARRREHVGAAALAAVREHERDAAVRNYIGTFSAWLVTRSVTRSTLEAQFPGTNLAQAWIGYANRVTNYLRLASIRDTVERQQIVDDLSGYLAPGSSEWRPLRTPPDQVTSTYYKSYVFADATLADALLLRKNAIVIGVLDAHAAGFSTRPRDLVDDLLPFVG